MAALNIVQNFKKNCPKIRPWKVITGTCEKLFIHQTQYTWLLQDVWNRLKICPCLSASHSNRWKRMKENFIINSTRHENNEPETRCTECPFSKRFPVSKLFALCTDFQPICISFSTVLISSIFGNLSTVGWAISMQRTDKFSIPPCSIFAGTHEYGQLKKKMEAVLVKRFIRMPWFRHCALSHAQIRFNVQIFIYYRKWRISVNQHKLLRSKTKQQQTNTNGRRFSAYICNLSVYVMYACMLFSLLVFLTWHIARMTK